MKKIKFREHVLPHLLAVLLFLVCTITFFNPIFFENKILYQPDIHQHEGSIRALRNFHVATGEEGLWAENMFSGMPANLLSINWDNGVILSLKGVLSFFLPHPVCNIFLALAGYYILLLAFRIRPYLAIAGAIAFGFSTFIIIGFVAGHNARIGAIAFMPWVMAGIHLSFRKQRIIGFGITALSMALELRENHLQITYYLMIIVVIYGMTMLWSAWQKSQIKSFFTSVVLLVPAVLIAIGSYFGPLWGIMEYTHYSIRGHSELTTALQSDGTNGLSKSYVFEYSNGILEPMTLLIPNFYGGGSSTYFVNDETSHTYRALVGSANEKVANQLAGFSSAYWGPQHSTAPYYAGAIFVFLFCIGIVLASRQYVIWLVSLSVLSIALSWGDHFASFNYWMLDYFPGYNKFRSVTFSLAIIFFSMPLLGLLGLENLLKVTWTSKTKTKILWTLAVVPGLCLLLAITCGLGGFLKPDEVDLPAWFRLALRKDRMDLFTNDAWRSFVLTFIFAVVLLACLKKWIQEFIVIITLIGLTIFDLMQVDNRVFSKNQFINKRDSQFSMTDADRQIAKDTSYYRVFNLNNPMSEAETSYFHNSVGGYHGAKLRRYLDFFDSCAFPQTKKMLAAFQINGGNLDFQLNSALNMLNVKYVLYNSRQGYIENRFAYGPAWYVTQIEFVNSANEELKKIGEIDPRQLAVVDQSKFKIDQTVIADSTATIRLVGKKPYWQKYETTTRQNCMAVFSEIYYPKGWHATIDSKEVPIIRADYILRALVVPAGKHQVEFTFRPNFFIIGNKITAASSWVVLAVVLWSLALSFFKNEGNLLFENTSKCDVLLK